MENIKIEFNSNMTFIVERTADGKIRPYVVMGTGDNITNEIVTEFEQIDEEDFIDSFTKYSSVDIFENESIIVSISNRDYDLIAYVENRTDKEIWIVFPENTGIHCFEIPPREWVGLLADEYGYSTLNELRIGNFEITTECPEE